MSCFTLHVHVHFYVCTCTSVSASVTPAAKSSYSFHDKTQHCHCHRDTRCYNVLLQTEDVTYLHVSGLSLYMCLYWLLCYDCGGCRLLAAAQSPSTPDSAPRMRTADRILSRPAVSSRRRCGCKHWHTLRHVHTLVGCRTCSNICPETSIVTFI